MDDRMLKPKINSFMLLWGDYPSHKVNTQEEIFIFFLAGVLITADQ